MAATAATATALGDEKPLYHLIQSSLWIAAVKDDKEYFPPTYEEDGFTHATAHAPFLLPVANHFYTGIKEPFLLLVIKPSLLTGQVKMEPAAPVGETEALSVHGEKEKEGGKEGGREEEVELFPHVYGGIPPKAVVGVLQVRRGEDGKFLGVEGMEEEEEEK